VGEYTIFAFNFAKDSILINAGKKVTFFCEIMLQNIKNTTAYKEK
jgi:hypothetical protein